MDEATLEALKNILAAAADVYNVLITGYIADKLDEALSPGGEIYEQIMEGALESAANWYSLYEPEKYERGYTLMARNNIDILHSISVDGTTINATCSTTNVAPHAVYSEGFWFYKRRELHWRPGGDLMESVPTTIPFKVDIPQDIADDYFEQALTSIL